MSLSAQQSFLEQVSLHRQTPSFANESVESNEHWTNVKLNWTNVNFVLVEGVGFDGQTCFLGHGSERFTFETPLTARSFSRELNASSVRPSKKNKVGLDLNYIF